MYASDNVQAHRLNESHVLPPSPVYDGSRAFSENVNECAKCKIKFYANSSLSVVCFRFEAQSDNRIVFNLLVFALAFDLEMSAVFVDVGNNGLELGIEQNSRKCLCQMILSAPFPAPSAQTVS